MFLLSCRTLVFFGGVLQTFFHIRWFLLPRVLGKNSLLPRLVFETLLGGFSGMSFGQSFGGGGGFFTLKSHTY